MTTLEQRVGQLEGVLPSLATKEDLGQLEVRLTRDIGNLKADLKSELIKVVIGLAGLQLIGLGAVAAIMKLLGD